jgi:uncharacterized protein YuzE
MWWSRRKTGRGSSRPGQTSIRVYLDQEVDAARVVVSDEPIARTVRAEGFGFVDLDADGNVVAIELFKVSKQIKEARRQRDELTDAPNLEEELRLEASRLVKRAQERVNAV